MIELETKETLESLFMAVDNELVELTLILDLSGSIRLKLDRGGPDGIIRVGLIEEEAKALHKALGLWLDR